MPSVPATRKRPSSTSAAVIAAGKSSAIEVRDVRKVYGSTVALQHAWLSVAQGEIHALLGENGAGKSTLVRILAGIENADSGEVRLLGQQASGTATERQRHGCAFIHQELGLFPDLTVAENICLVGGFATRTGLISGRRTRARARSILDRLGMKVDPGAQVGELLLAEQTQVAVARALSRGARLIVLDEPTAYLEVAEARKLFALLGRLRDQDVACLIITHRAEDVLASCDRFTVMRDGITVASEPTKDATEADLVRLITGHDDGTATTKSASTIGPKIVRMHDGAGPGFDALSLSVAAGEIVGLCGLADAGHFAVGEVMFGLAAPSRGSIMFDGRDLEFRTPAQAMAAGIGFVPRDRRSIGLGAELTCRENVYMRPHGSWYRFIRTSVERRDAQALLQRFRVRPPDPDRQVATLSGGNQQKVLLAKWINRHPQLLILNEPTAGVDLGARAEIYEHVRQACSRDQLAVLVASSDFVEIAGFCDRAIVMRQGRPVAELAGPRLTSHALTDLAYGGTL